MSADDWLLKAKGFIENAKLIVEHSQATGSRAPGVGWLAWQGAENSLKAVCTGHTLRKSHDLSEVMKHIKANHLINSAELANISAAAQIVTGSATYNNTRYPENNPKWWESRTQEQLIEVTKAAQSIYEICAKKVVSR
jgi:HEPN domain-containing protein